MKRRVSDGFEGFRVSIFRGDRKKLTPITPVASPDFQERPKAAVSRSS